ncbi:hypothetical protein, partial [Staphylococcus aureus]
MKSKLMRIPYQKDASIDIVVKLFWFTFHGFYPNFHKYKNSTTNIKILNIATYPNVIINLLHKEINYLFKGGGITCLLLKNNVSNKLNYIKNYG